VTDRGATLVVVEDDEDVRRALTRFLTSYGFGVRAFESAEASLADVRAADVAIVDINLPGISGLEMDDRMKREGRGIPTIFITAQDEPALASDSRTILQKPLDPQLLLDVIDHVLATRDGPGVIGKSS